MVERTNEVLKQLHRLVAGAKAVPMSASCMVNRAEVLALIEQAADALQTDVGEAQRRELLSGLDRDGGLWSG